MKRHPRKKAGYAGTERYAFSLVELLVVVVVIVLLAGVLVPALATSKTRGQDVRCLSNQMRLAQAWSMYAEDNSGRLVPNYVASTNAWVLGAVHVLPGATNLDNLTRGLLWRYTRNAEVYRCDADNWSVLGGVPQPVLKVRSCSMNGRLNSDVDWVQGAKYPDLRKLADIKDPSPRRCLVFLDESAYTIDDGYFALPVGTNPGMWENSPSGRHDNGAVLSFADGHVELWRWVEPTTQFITSLDYFPPKKSEDRDLRRLSDAILIK